MGEIGIHLEYVVRSVAQRPVKSGDVSSPQPLFAVPMQDMDATWILLCQPLCNLACSIWRVVIYDEHF